MPTLVHVWLLMGECAQPECFALSTVAHWTSLYVGSSFGADYSEHVKNSQVGKDGNKVI